MDVNEAKILQLSGERRKETEEESEQWHRVERRSGKFLRRFRLPKNVKVEDIKTSMEDGILTVIVPKIEGVKPEIKSIAISYYICLQSCYVPLIRTSLITILVYY